MNFAPFLRFRYKFSKTESLALDYRGRSKSPTMTQLQPVPDYSDPLRVVQGNPELLPSFTHRFNVRYNNFNKERQSSIMTFVSADLTQNSIVTNTQFDKNTGGRTITYDNVNGDWTLSGMLMYNSPVGHKGWRVSNHTFLRYARTVGYNNGLLNKSGNLMVSQTPGVAFRTDIFDVELRPYYTLQHTSNSVQQDNRLVHSYGSRFNAGYYAPFGLSISTDVSYGNSIGYFDGFDNEQWLWNAAVSYSFLKGKSATISLKAYDILREKQNISRAVTANYIEDREFNTVTRYFMLSLTYKFAKMGDNTEPPAMDYGGHHIGPGPRGGHRMPPPR